MNRLLLVLFAYLLIQCTSKDIMQDHSRSYLALGDSYTIGESVPESGRFPEQTVKLLSAKSFVFSPPQIIAKTGWTTGNLLNAIAGADLHPPYDLVSLLIGVNNQYQGRSIDEYETEFELLLTKAIELAGKDTTRVVVFSIPDWGATPFASGRNREQISREIDAFNAVNKRITLNKNVQYIDITPGTREAINDPALVAADGLHPSAKEYARWAEAFITRIEHRLK